MQLADNAITRVFIPAEMFRRLLRLPLSTAAASTVFLAPVKNISRAASDHHFQISFRRHFIDLHKMMDKDAVVKERARLKDELSRGYFADIAEMRENKGKISPANKTLIPLTAAVEFPVMTVFNSDGSSIELPLSMQKVNSNHEEIIPYASLYCLSFRASSQRMAESWIMPFLDAFDASSSVHVYEVSFIDSWLLSLSPVRKILLTIAKSSTNPRRRFVYSFGDHYDFRKKLQILNLLTGYIFLLDRHGRVRWQGFGSATSEELSCLVSSTSVLLEQK